MKLYTRLAMTVISTLAATSTVFAASTGTLLLQGQVQEVLDVVVIPNGSNTNLNILAGETDLNVATVEETSNRLTGYSIKLSSATEGELRHTVESTQKTTYTVSYDGAAAVAPTSTGVVVKTVSSLSGLTTDTSNLNVNVASLATAVAGTYQDTLTVTIEAN